MAKIQPLLSNSREREPAYRRLEHAVQVRRRLLDLLHDSRFLSVLLRRDTGERIGLVGAFGAPRDVVEVAVCGGEFSFVRGAGIGRGSQA